MCVEGVINMKITTTHSLNFDLLCLLNVMTADKFYTKLHKKEFKKFYPLLSDDIKAKIKAVTDRRNTTMLWPLIALLISSLDDYANRDLCEMLAAHDEIRGQINQSPYIFTDEKLDGYFSDILNVVIPFVKEMVNIGVVEYWTQTKLPALEKRCAALNEYLQKYNIYDEISNLKTFDEADITMYLCAFAAPHGCKLVGYNMISHYKWPDKTILSVTTHEMFHPPYDRTAVDDAATKLGQAIIKLGQLPWVVTAYENQNENRAYRPMNGFIEENIVEALGIYVLTKLVRYNAHKYFRKHDYGSHVISPHFYDYLNDYPKNREQTFEEYFIDFVDYLVAKEG